MSRKSYRMKLSEFDSATPYACLEFGDYIERSPGDFGDPLISSVCGPGLGYGNLFAYCFRRFGYPNFGWDGYKDLASYLVSTPREDMRLLIEPSVSDCTVFSFKFFIPRSAGKDIEIYARRDQTAWTERALDWCESKGLPEWMAEWVDCYNTEYIVLFGLPEALSWRDTMNVVFAIGEVGSRLMKMTRLASRFREDLMRQFSLIEPSPNFCTRSADMKLWAEDDPLKPYAEAAIRTLEDLYRPVRVRDQAINVLGVVEETRNTLKEPAVAGYPAGLLGNAAPSEVARLHGLILKLGKGNVRRGINKVLEASERLLTR